MEQAVGALRTYIQVCAPERRNARHAMPLPLHHFFPLCVLPWRRTSGGFDPFESLSRLHIARAWGGRGGSTTQELSALQVPRWQLSALGDAALLQGYCASIERAHAGLRPHAGQHHWLHLGTGTGVPLMKTI
eukprot:COSAG01_NODE_14281_length_1473_cov_1.474527_1_plen_131_part_10